MKDLNKGKIVNPLLVHIRISLLCLQIQNAISVVDIKNCFDRFKRIWNEWYRIFRNNNGCVRLIVDCVGDMHCDDMDAEEGIKKAIFVCGSVDWLWLLKYSHDY